MGYRELQPEDENLVTGLTDDGSVPGEEAPHSRPEVGVAAIRMQVEGWSAPELKKAQEPRAEKGSRRRLILGVDR